MIEIDGKLINPAHIVSAEVETRHYMNGSVSQLVVELDDGSRIVRERGFGFDAFFALAKIKGQWSCATTHQSQQTQGIVAVSKSDKHEMNCEFQPSNQIRQPALGEIGRVQLRIVGNKVFARKGPAFNRSQSEG